MLNINVRIYYHRKQ